LTAKRVILKLNIILMETSPPGCNTIGNLAGSFVVILRGLVPCYDPDKVKELKVVMLFVSFCY